MTNITGFTFLSTDGKTQLHGMRWEPEGRSVRAVLQICHGVAEHIARYDAFARYLNELGIAVVGHDHLGHGRSLPEGGTPVYFGEGNTWQHRGGRHLRAAPAHPAVVSRRAPVHYGS